MGPQRMGDRGWPHPLPSKSASAFLPRLRLPASSDLRPTLPYHLPTYLSLQQSTPPYPQSGAGGVCSANAHLFSTPRPPWSP